jgi:hypothetical protein
MKWFVWLCLLIAVAGPLLLGSGILATQYVFQEPAQVTWSRYLLPEFLWQRQKYPSMRWAFDLLEPLVRHRDPRLHFIAFENAPPLDRPSSWTSPLFGPQLSKIEEPIVAGRKIVAVTTVQELKTAIASARPGEVIQIEPGTYTFSGTNIAIAASGEADLPITLRADTLGTVLLRFALLEGFHVQAPFWNFENLVIEGVCKNDSRCEHAFHVVGAASGVVIRNNWVANFNAAIKVNGKDGRFPDDGLILENAFINERPRATDNPVAVLDFVAASRWHVRRNVIADFAKAGGNHTSYGAFFKGAGTDNVFEQNLVRCEWRHGGGARVGFSFGDGGTARRHCRDGQCQVEHMNGIARNNIIMDCPNDVGIYLYKSAQTAIINNALINTRGIDIHLSGGGSSIANNIIDGRILARDGSTYSGASNIVNPKKAMLLGKVTDDLYVDPEGGDLHLRTPKAVQGRGSPIVYGGQDLCDRPYEVTPPDIGPFQYRPEMACSPVIP